MKSAVPRQGIRQQRQQQHQQQQQPDEPLKYSDIARQEGRADVTLIEAIERDIIEAKVNVSWDAIAGLTEAKHLLQVEHEITIFVVSNNNSNDNYLLPNTRKRLCFLCGCLTILKAFVGHGKVCLCLVLQGQERRCLQRQ
jgi:hypothetical protein